MQKNKKRWDFYYIQGQTLLLSPIFPTINRKYHYGTKKLEKEYQRP